MVVWVQLIPHQHKQMSKIKSTSRGSVIELAADLSNHVFCIIHATSKSILFIAIIACERRRISGEVKRQPEIRLRSQAIAISNQKRYIVVSSQDHYQQFPESSKI